MMLHFARDRAEAGAFRESSRGLFSEKPPQLVKKGFDKLVDGEARSPRHCHPHQFLLKSKRFPGAKTAG
ncbi:MAG: hypothetical protein PUK86_00485, partial [bacterium]|nr:hypothetical protein [bacterium]